MNIFLMGGWMMWPLALVSIAVTAIVIERLLFFSSCKFPDKNFTGSLEQALAGNPEKMLAAFQSVQFLKDYATILGASQNDFQDSRTREAALRIEGEAVVRRLERYLPTLGILARLAPLMGLLGTVLGMINTFSEIAGANAGVNMNQLAGGIWQALITTAAGLIIAIPALFFLHEFQTRIEKIAQALSEAGNTALLVAVEKNAVQDNPGAANA